MADDPTRSTPRSDAAIGGQQGIWGMAHAPDPGDSSGSSGAPDRGPVRLAQAAYERGDQLFQIDLVVSAVQGAVTNSGVMTRTVRGEATDVLGAIEAQGWR